jgi:hypothetical protein
MPPVPEIPDLRIVPLERIRPHEEVDPLRVEPLAARIGSERTQLNPVVCIESGGDDLVLLDGATRTASLRSLGLEFAVVQVVQSEDVGLGTWHHVLRDAGPAEVLSSIESRTELALSGEGSAPRVWLPDGSARAVIGSGVSDNAALSMLVSSYIGRWKVNRVIETGADQLGRQFPDWGALIEFPALSIRDVTEAALGADLLPAGITRFVVPERALRLNYNLDELRGGESLQIKQERLDGMIQERARLGRVRRYAEPVIILDD